MKWLTTILIFLSIINTALADQGKIETYKPNEVFDLSVYLSNGTGSISGATCQVEIRNKSLQAIYNATLTEIRGGWYNTTYNTSEVGKYFCRQNCTKESFYTAEACNFIIEGEETMNLAIILMFGVFAFILTALAITTQQLILKGFFMLMDLGIVVLGINTAKLIAVAGGASASIVKMLNTAFSVGIWMLYTLVAIGAIYGLYHAFIYLRNLTKPDRQNQDLEERKYEFKLR